MKNLNVFDDVKNYESTMPKRISFDSVNLVNNNIMYDKKINLDDYIVFNDEIFKGIIVSNFGSNGEITYREALNVKDFGTLFLNNKEIKSIEGIQYFSNLKGSMVSLFEGCSNLIEIPKLSINNFRDLENPTNDYSANAMFMDCTGLETVEYIDFSNCEKIRSTFNGCTSLKNINVNTKNVKELNRTWYKCTGLTSFPLIDTSFAASLYATWYGCTGLTKFPCINTSNVYDLNSAWYNCSSLTSFPLIDTSNVKDMTFGWGGCTKLTNFPLINTSSAYDLNSAWYNCLSLTSFPLIDTSNVTNMRYTWGYCSSLTSFPAINTSNVTNMYGSWYRCTGLKEFPLIDTSNVTILQCSWYNCIGLTSFPAINTSNVTNMQAAWYGCTGLTSFPLIDTSNVIDLSATWSGCSKLTNETFPIDQFDFSSVKWVAQFTRNTNLSYIPKLNFPNLESIEYAFIDCKASSVEPFDYGNKVMYMVGIWQSMPNLTSFPVMSFKNVPYTGKNWNNCKLLSTFASYDFENVKNLGYNWLNCSALETFENELIFGDESQFNVYRDLTEKSPYADINNVKYNEYKNHSAWKGCTALKNIKIKQNCVNHNIDFVDSALLSDESIDSIINALKPQETTGKTITLHADVKAKLTAEQLQMINDKNWTLI